MTDDLDKKIIRALNQNGRKSFREIAKEIGTSDIGDQPHKKI